MSYQIEVVNLPAQSALVVRGHVDHQGIAGFLGQAFGEVMGLAQRQHAQIAGPPFGRYQPTGDGGWDIEAGFPVSEAPAVDGPVEMSSLPGGLAARTMHVGDYGALSAAYEAVSAWLADNGYQQSGTPWECYLDGPEVSNPRTQIFFPCRNDPADQ